ncbi:MAG: hypothetical protein AB7U97_05210 [Pirellulales bacterium]
MPVDRTGGRYGQGLIEGVSIITRGEALGHGYWLDAEFLESVRDGMAGNELGVKSRFTHPGLSSDGLATHLGRAMTPDLMGDQVFAEVHFTSSSHKTPDGDLADYTMSMAEESPEDVAISIVFDPDFEAEREHFIEHGGKIEIDPIYGIEIWDNSEFESPDPDNKQGLPHARLADLRAADFVGDPAANPGGLFQREQQFAAEADQLAAFAVGISNKRPAAGALGLDADRARGFLTRFLTSHNLEIRPMSKLNDAGGAAPTAAPAAEPAAAPAAAPAPAAPVEQKPAEQPAATEPTPAADSLSDVRAEMKKFRVAFGEKGPVYFDDGLTFAEATAKHIEQLSADNKKLREQLGEANKKLGIASSSEGELAPIGFQPSEPAKGTGFKTKIRIK